MFHSFNYPIMRIINTVSLLFCGLSIGWLIGLSISPIIQTIIGSLLAIITSLLTLSFSIQEGQIKDKITDKFGTINVLPLALFLVGLSFSATVGIYARTNEWLGVNPESYKRKWEMKDKDASGIIKNLYDKQNKSERTASNTNFSEPVLFNFGEDCKKMLNIDDVNILYSMLNSYGPPHSLFADSVMNYVDKKNQLQVLKQRIRLNCN